MLRRLFGVWIKLFTGVDVKILKLFSFEFGFESQNLLLELLSISNSLDRLRSFADVMEFRRTSERSIAGSFRFSQEPSALHELEAAKIFSSKVSNVRANVALKPKAILVCNER